MALRTLRPKHYKTLMSFALPITAFLFGSYQQFLHDQDATTYKNKSKLFGGKSFPEGKEAWY